MSNRIINTLNEFYVYADANVFDSTSAINLKIDIDNLIENDRYQIQLITECLKYSMQAGKLIPLFTYPDGTSYPDIKTLTDEDIKYLSSYLSISKNQYIRAKINHFLFIKAKCKNKINFAHDAIDSYFCLINHLFGSEENDWFELSQLYNNLIDLVFKVNYKIEDAKEFSIKVIKTSKKYVLVRDALCFLIEKVKKKKFKKSVLNGFINICKSNIKNSKDNISWVECFVNLGREISKIQNGNEQQWDLLLAKAYENEMIKAQKINNNGIVSAHWCEKSIAFYKKAKNKLKAEKLFTKYNELCKTIQYTEIDSEPIDLTNIINDLKSGIDKSCDSDILNGLIFSFIPKFVDNKNSAIENRDLALSNLFSPTYNDQYGQVVGYADTENENSKYELWNSYNISFELKSILLQHYIKYSLETNKLNAEILINYLKTTWLGKTLRKQLTGDNVLKYQWLEHIEQPIISYFDKLQKYIIDSNFRLTFINEVDSLTLKIEGILRDIIEFAQIKNFQVRKFDKDKNNRQISKWKTINELLWDPLIFKILKDDDIWFMRYFLTDYLDVRNNIAHCLALSPYQDQYYKSFEWLVVIVLRLSKYVTLTPIES